MSLVDAPLSLFPTAPGAMGNGGGATAFTFDASTDLWFVVFRVPKTGTLSNVHYRIVGVTSPSMTHRIELRTVDATTGLPNAAGTLYGSSTSITVAASGYSANTNYTAAVNATMTAGDIVALVFDLSAFTSGSFTQLERAGILLYGDALSTGVVAAFPYSGRNTTGSTAKEALRCTGFALEYNTGFVPVDMFYNWVGSASVTTVTSTGAIRRAANIFRPTTPRRAVGIYALADVNGDCLFRLRLASDDSILGTATVDKDQAISTALMSFYRFGSGTTVNLAAGTDYYIAMEGNDATGGTLGRLDTAPSASMLDIMPGGQNCNAYTHDGASWSQVSSGTARYHIGLLTDQEDDGSGGGGVTMGRVFTGM